MTPKIFRSPRSSPQIEINNFFLEKPPSPNGTRRSLTPKRQSPLVSGWDLEMGLKIKTCSNYCLDLYAPQHGLDCPGMSLRPIHVQHPRKSNIFFFSPSRPWWPKGRVVGIIWTMWTCICVCVLICMLLYVYFKGFAVEEDVGAVGVHVSMNPHLCFNWKFTYVCMSLCGSWWFAYMYYVCFCTCRCTHIRVCITCICVCNYLFVWVLSLLNFLDYLTTFLNFCILFAFSFLTSCFHSHLQEMVFSPSTNQEFLTFLHLLPWTF